MNEKPNPATLFNKLAKLYEEKYMDPDLYDDTYDFLCKEIPTNAEILEIACGPGNITKYLLKKRPDFKILGTDLAPNMLELAKINNPQAEFQLLDGKEISTLRQKYDAIICGFFLPYLSKEETLQFIEDAAAQLKSNGILYLSTMEDDYSNSGLKSSSTGEQLFMHYHEENYLTEAMHKNRLNTINLQRKDFPTQDNTKVTDLILIGQLPT